MRSLYFTPSAIKDLKDLDITVQKQVKAKMTYFCSAYDPFIYAKKLVNHPKGERRFRIGDYRVICDRDDEGKLIILAVIGHRKEIYDG